jgi:hypothetical protein
MDKTSKVEGSYMLCVFCVLSLPETQLSDNIILCHI